VSTTVPCAFLSEYTVSSDSIWLRLSKLWSFDPSISLPMLEVRISGEFDKVEMGRLLLQSFEGEIDEFAISDFGVTISVNGSNVFVPGRVEMNDAAYSIADFIAAYRKVEEQNTELHRELRQACIKIAQTKALVESLITRANIKQESYVAGSDAWVSYSRQKDLMKRILHRLES